jgi:hypothetical protein
MTFFTWDNSLAFALKSKDSSVLSAQLSPQEEHSWVHSVLIRSLSHSIKFRVSVLEPSAAPVPLAATTAAGLLQAVTQLVFTAFNPEDPPMDQRFGNFSSRIAIHPLDGRAGDVHLIGALLLREVLQVDQTDRLIFVHGHHNKRFLFGQRRVQRPILGALRQATDFPPFSRPWHAFTSFP